tara:strand:+ start:1797 stop:1916 length:120 start_codon:yes stop_codon:yes gene_type:complete
VAVAAAAATLVAGVKGVAERAAVETGEVVRVDRSVEAAV